MGFIKKAWKGAKKYASDEFEHQRRLSQERMKVRREAEIREARKFETQKASYNRQRKVKALKSGSGSFGGFADSVLGPAPKKRKGSKRSLYDELI